MLSYLLQRLVSLLIVMFLILIITFSLLHLVPGDPAVVILGVEATPERIEIMQERLGLHRPLYMQFLTYLNNVIRGDLGQSIFLDQPVVEAILSRFPITLFLASFSLLWAIILGIPTGIIAAIKRGSFVDRMVMTTSLLGMSIPSFWLGLNLIMIFGVWLRWLPTGGYVLISENFWGSIRHMILPSFSLGFIQTAQIARMTRSAMLEVLQEDYINTARSKGLHENVVIFKHALKNSMLSIITVIGLIFALLFGGTVITEQIFTLPGLGQLIIRGVSHRDYPIIQGSLVVVGFVYVLVNLLIDLTYTYLDPRIVYDK